MEIAYNGEPKVNALEEVSVECEEARIPKGKGLRPSSSPPWISFERETPTGTIFQKKEDQPTCFACQNGDGSKGMPLITGIHLSVPFIKHGQT